MYAREARGSAGALQRLLHIARASISMGQRYFWLPWESPEVLWMDELLHHLRNPGMMIPLQIPTMFVFFSVNVLQHFVHPQYGHEVSKSVHTHTEYSYSEDLP